VGGHRDHGDQCVYLLKPSASDPVVLSNVVFIVLLPYESVLNVTEKVVILKAVY
jgi:hypothetical protein